MNKVHARHRRAKSTISASAPQVWRAVADAGRYAAGEVSEVAFWSPGSRLGPISEIDGALLEEYSNHGFTQQPHAAWRDG